MALKRPGETARAFLELKSLDKSTNGRNWTLAHDSRQFARFGELPAWAISNFHEVRFYNRDEDQGHAILVPEAALDPDRTDSAADALIDAHDASPALRLIERLAQSDPPSAKDAEHLAELLAHSARLVRGIVRDRLAELALEGAEDEPLQQVRREFRDVLYSHPEAAGYSSADFDALFSAAFAQTLAFGLLLVREATGQVVDTHAHERMPDEHPLMKTALRVLSLPEVAEDVGAGFAVMLQTVNSFELKILAIRKDGSDPILYFYENFLSTFDPDARERYGVYYTPTEVVRFMVGALDRTLRERLETQGIADPQVHILDPATGTGTFLLGVADRLRREVSEIDGPGQAPAALRGLAKRMYGFELLIGPYAVAHYRLHHALSRRPDGTAEAALNLPRLGVYLTDTLARPGAAAPLGGLGFVSEGIHDERALSDRVKSEQAILAIIGNPPYRRLEVGENETLVGRWMDTLWDDLKRPVSDAGKGNQLNTFPELSVAFWRWSIWKLFEAHNAPKRGVIAFITNRKFLTGWPYAGLRKMMRERFDRIEIIDLRGDVRTGERADVESDQGVFNIRVGTCITLAIADGSKAEGTLSDVYYNDAWTSGHMSRKSKLDWMLMGEQTGQLEGAISVVREAMADMRPRPFLNGSLVSIDDIFEYSRGGVQTKRDEFIYDVSREGLIKRISDFVSGTDVAAQRAFKTTGENSWSEAKAVPFSDQHVLPVAYRPLDTRFLYNHRAYGAYLRWEMQELWGASNYALYAMPKGTNSGPAVWCHGLLPDLHAFSGRGGYAYPLYDRRPGHDPVNLKAELVAALEDAYGSEVGPEQVFDAVLCLLSGSSYTTHFAEDLEDVFPHVPFPADRSVFDDAARVGAEIRAVETFARVPSPQFLKGLAVNETAATGKLAAVEYEDGSIALCADGSGRIVNIPEAVWSFSVSGYRLLPRWLAAREGIELPDDFVPQVRDIVGRIAELIDLFVSADSILKRTLEDPLSREALGFSPSAAAVTPDPTSSEND
ncbi:hypothetical protein AMEJIAPC_01472 [Caulobacter sp. NIBR1757]|nr:hypothetical protein AMEJIAPC_01472 [Caulobacter sp. NIBR1757]